MRVLILGGTTEASELASLLADVAAASSSRFTPTLSFAGRTREPRLPPIAFRTGGFGGVDGLTRWLIEHHIDALIDATHPFAARISANAVSAADRAGVPFASIVRPPWAEIDGDRWCKVGDAGEAAVALGLVPRRVFLGVGRLELPAFAAAPQHTYVARTIEPPGALPLPPDTTLISDRGPFALEDELGLFEHNRIEIVVSKHSGGAATYAKIEAARRLGLDVVMISRPVKPCGVPLADAQAALLWLETLQPRH